MEFKYKFYTGNIMMCMRYEKGKLEDNIKNSSIYQENAFFYRLKDNTFFHIEDGPDSELTSFISLAGDEALAKSSSHMTTTPNGPFDMYIDENSLEAYLIRDKNNNPVR